MLFRSKRWKFPALSRVYVMFGCREMGCPQFFFLIMGPNLRLLLDFYTSVNVRSFYSKPCHPQGNSVVDCYMLTIEKTLSALVAEDGRDWNLILSAVALAQNSTPHVATGVSPYFLTHGREAIMPIQRHLDEPRLDGTARLWLQRPWKARIRV